MKVGAFEYESVDDSNQAIDEQNKIAKLEEKMDYNNPKVVYSLYCKMISKRIFKSPEGLLYLLHLQEYLEQNSMKLDANIPSIPADMFSKIITKEVIKEVTKIVYEESNVSNNSEISNSDSLNSIPSIDGVSNEGKDDKDNPDENSDDNEDIKDLDDNLISAEEDNEIKADMIRIHQRNFEDLMKKYKRIVEKNKKIYERMTFQRIAIFLLMVVVIVMLTIAKKSDTPTILNYREKIQNEYASWEEQLKDKEQQLNEREKELEKITSEH